MIGTKVEDHLDGATNFMSWKSRVLILEENDLLKLVNEKVLEQTLKNTSLIGGRVMSEQEESC